VFENSVLRRIFGPKRDEVMGGLRKLQNEELCSFYSLPSIIRLIKSRRMSWARQVACRGKRRNFGEKDRRKWTKMQVEGKY
jgi:hypothetical protein